MTEIKQASFRLNKETTEKFKEYCEENQLTAAQGFDYLMEVMALDNARTTLHTRETEISNFEQHAKALISAFLHSLELNENAEARIKEQFSTQLESQAQTIMHYQEEITALKQQIEEFSAATESLQTDNSILQESLTTAETRLRNSQDELASLKEDKTKQLADKDSIITMLSSKLAEAEYKANEYDDLKAKNSRLQSDLTNALQTIKDEAKDAEIAKERAVRDAEKKLEAEFRKELDRLRSQNTELLQTVAMVERTSAEQIRAVEKENADLREKVATLKRNETLKIKNTRKST